MYKLGFGHRFLAVFIAIQVGVTATSVYGAGSVTSKARLPKTTLEVLAYAIGGPPHHNSRRAIINTSIVVGGLTKKPSIYYLGRNKAGGALFKVSPGVYKVTSALQTNPPITCEPAPVTVIVHKNHHPVVRVYCSVR